MLEEEFDVVGEEDAHLGGVIRIEHLLQVHDVFEADLVGDVGAGVEVAVLLEGLALEPGAVGVRVLVAVGRTLLAFVWGEGDLGGLGVLAGVLRVGEGLGLHFLTSCHSFYYYTGYFKSVNSTR